MTTDTLLTPAEVWSGKIYSNGWKKPRYAFANRGQRFLTNYDEWLAGQGQSWATLEQIPASFCREFTQQNANGYKCF
jgi:hypothetical protein